MKATTPSPTVDNVEHITDLNIPHPSVEQVQSWDHVETARQLQGLGVEVKHCEIFENQEITGEVLLDMDNTFIFMERFDFGVMGRRLKTWHKIETFQKEVKQLQQASAKTSPVARHRRLIPVNDTFCRREDTVRKLFDLLISERVVQVRGTPTTGKTVLATLLFNYIISEKLLYEPVYFQWQLYGEGTREKASWLRFLCANSEGIVDEETFNKSNNVIVMVDEAQLSYKDNSFWLECVKELRQRTFGPFLILFSSFGSPTATALQIEGSAPIELLPRQRVSLLRQIGSTTDLSLCFNFNEAEDMCSSVIGNRSFKVDKEVLRYLFILTNGHPGLTYGLLKAFFEREDVRPLILTCSTVTMTNASRFFGNDDALFFCIENCVGRSLPKRRDLQKPENGDLVELLRRAVENYGIEAFEPENIRGLEDAYRKGYLHATSTHGEGINLYSFPSLLHHRAVERLLFPSADDSIQCELKELCFAALEKFSPTSLQSHARKINRIPGATRPEAQYAYELYRCLYVITGGKCIIHTEYSYTVEGRIDFFIKSRQWGIECIKDSDRMSNHENRFQGKGAYGSWGIVCDYVILNFCTKPPKKKER